MDRDVIKSNIIQELLFKFVKQLSKHYDDYFNVWDSNMVSDEEMYIYVDRYHEINDNGKFNMGAYKEYLRTYEEEFNIFIKVLKRELPNNLEFSINYSYTFDKEIDGKEHWESCELHFKIGE